MKELLMLPTVETERLILRPVTIDDVADLYEYGSDGESNQYLTWKPYTSIDDAYNSIVNYFLKRPEHGLPEAYAIVWKENNKMIGTCDFVSLSLNHRHGEIGYVLNRNYWGLGIMSEAVRVLIEYGFKNLDLIRIQIQCDVNNTQSERVADKLGFKFEGIRRKAILKWDGNPCDLKMYSLTIDDFNKEELLWLKN